MSKPDQLVERVLSDLGDHVAWPAHADLSERVTRRLSVVPSRPPRRRWIPVGAVVLALIAAVLLISPGARRAVADLLGVAGVEIVVVPELGELPGGGLDLGEPVTLDEAARSVEFAISVPSALDPPGGVFVGDRPGGSLVTMVWAAGEALPASDNTDIGLLYDQFSPNQGEGGFVKAYGAGTDLVPVEIDGALGFWIEGAPHLITYEDAAGNEIEEATRLAANVLVWEGGGVTHRLETLLGLDDALGIARSIERLR